MTKTGLRRDQFAYVDFNETTNLRDILSEVLPAGWVDNDLGNISEPMNIIVLKNPDSPCDMSAVAASPLYKSDLFTIQALHKCDDIVLFFLSQIEFISR